MWSARVGRYVCFVRVYWRARVHAMRKRRTRGSVADIRIVEGETQEGLVGASLQSLGDRKSDGRVRSRAGI